MADFLKKLNSYKKQITLDGNNCYVDIEFSEDDVLISLMGIDDHVRKISSSGIDVADAVEKFDSKLLTVGIIL